MQWHTVDKNNRTDRLHYEGYAGKLDWSSLLLFFGLSRCAPDMYHNVGAMASFFMTGDPNALKLTKDNVAGVPPLETGDEFVVDDEGFTSVDMTQFKMRCGLWSELAPRVPM